MRVERDRKAVPPSLLDTSAYGLLPTSYSLRVQSVPALKAQDDAKGNTGGRNAISHPALEVRQCHLHQRHISFQTLYQYVRP